DINAAMPAGPTDRPSRARPVADAPVAALIAGADELAKGWLLELVASGPLAAASGLPLDDLVRDGPALCAAMARALSDDAELARPASDDRVRVADLRTLIRPPFGEDEEEGDDQSPPRVADGDPRTHLAARAAEFVEDGRPFAVLLVELDGVEALLAAERDEE